MRSHLPPFLNHFTTPEGDPYPSSGVIFGAKKSLIGEYAPSAGTGRLRPCCHARPQSVPTTLLLASERWVFFPHGNSLELMMKLRHKSVGSGTVSGSKLLTYGIVLLTEDKDEFQ